MPDRSSSVKLGAGVPSGTMSDESAITSAYKCAQALLSSPTVHHASHTRSSLLPRLGGCPGRHSRMSIRAASRSRSM